LEKRIRFIYVNKLFIKAMKITIGGSMTFAKEQLEASRFLQERGYEIFLTEDINHFIEKPEIKDDAIKSLELSIQYDVIREFFDKIANSDAYLVCNYEKNGIKGYLGASVLMEIGLAYYLKKKIYLLFDIDHEQKYAHEIDIIKPVVLNGEKTDILNYLEN